MKSPLVVTIEEPRTGARRTYVFRRSPVVLGRDPAACDLTIVRLSVSKVHAELSFDDASVRFRDLDSRNGSLVDGGPIPAETDVTVPPDGSVVIGGALRLTFSRDASAKADEGLDPFAGPVVGQPMVAQATEMYSGPPIAPSPKAAPEDVPPPERPATPPPAPASPVPMAPLEDLLTVAEPSPNFRWDLSSPAPASPLPPTMLLDRKGPERPPAPVARQEPQPASFEAAKASPGEQVEVGDVIAHYRVERLIGRGGMGAIFEVSHTRASAKRFALKVLARDVIGHPEAEPRFLREAQAASRVSHPHVVAMVDFGKDRGIPYLVFELLEGTDLGDLIRRRPNLAFDRIADIMLAVCSGVSAAHELGIIHRDLKPQNIFLQRTATENAVPKVLDFGISKIRDPGAGSIATRAFSLIGTPNYLSPEQAAGNQRVDSLADVYALGTILYECVTGRPAHDGPTLFAVLRSIVEADYPLPSELRPDTPRELEAVILKAMARDPRDRFASVHEMGAALLPFASLKRQAFWMDYYAPRPGAADMSGFAAVPITMSRHASQVPQLGGYVSGGTRLLADAFQSGTGRSESPRTPAGGGKPASGAPPRSRSPLPSHASEGSRSVPPTSNPTEGTSRRATWIVGAGLATAAAVALVVMAARARPSVPAVPAGSALSPAAAPPVRPTAPPPGPGSPAGSMLAPPGVPVPTPASPPPSTPPPAPSAPAAPGTNGTTSAGDSERRVDEAPPSATREKPKRRRPRAPERNRSGVPILRP